MSSITRPDNEGRAWLFRASALALLAACAAAMTPSRPPEAKLRLTLQTLHAASLTAPRTPADSVDEPYLLVSVLGPTAAAENIHLPASGHLRIHQRRETPAFQRGWVRARFSR
ncbi:MAG TPA: hypothetical protein VGM50_17520 [Gemmatimonadaceae bacterium]